jgi:hypothetical protein
MDAVLMFGDYDPAFGVVVVMMWPGVDGGEAGGLAEGQGQGC